MTPVEKVETAIAKLESYRAEATPGDWLHTPSEFEIYDDTANTIAENVYPYDAGLIVTLHRTIDAQLELLGIALKYERSVWGTGSAETFHRTVLDLAEAILGDLS